jgi:fatty acid desaturase
MKRKLKQWGYESRGIPFTVGCLPVMLFLGLLIAIQFVAPNLIEQCIGQSVEPPRGKAAIIYFALELACSPLLLFGSFAEIAFFLSLLVSVIAMGTAWLWTRKHQAYWDVIRSKENEHRRKKRLEKTSKNEHGL